MPDVLTFTTSEGSPDGRQYFQDIELSPVTLASGALVERLDVTRYPGSGTRYV